MQLTIAGLLFGVMQSAVPGPAGATVRVVPPADSARIVHGARSAQRDFEVFRRAHLPSGDSYGGGDCDVRIGRYCYWRGDDDDASDDPPPENLVITAHRIALIHQLDSASMLIGGDPWIAGQYVHYLVQAGRTDDALHYAAGCRAGAAWCAALAGYAAHAAGRFATADSAYRIALAAMEPAARCRWLDISDLIDDEVADRFKHLPCEDREAFVRRLFRVASPLFSISDEDLFTEFLTRETRARIAEHATSTRGDAWGDDERELVLRYGWPTWYSRAEAPYGSLGEPSITGHEAGMPYDFLPTVHALDHLAHFVDDDWHLSDPRSQNGYAPRYARTIHDLPSQMAVFRRGDSTLVVAAWDARRDTTLLGRPLDAALALVGVDSTGAVARASGARVVSRIAVTGMIDSGMVSLELLAAADRRAARARIPLPPRAAGTIALSDILLHAPTAEPAYDLDAVRDSALASGTISGARNVGAYWEAYGLPQHPEPVHYTLSVEQIQIGWLQRTREKLHLEDPATGLRIQWDEVPRQEHGIASRGVRLDLSRLRGGRYRVELTLTARGENPVSTVREIEVK